MPDFPKLRSRLPDLEPIVNAWRLSAELHEFNAPASEDDIHRAETQLGRSLPPELRSLYELGNGMNVLGGNLQIEPLTGSGDDFTIFSLTESAKEILDDFPDEVVAFGGNGGDEHFGVWLPPGKATSMPVPVLEIGELWDAPPFAVAGTTITRFLRGWSAYYLMLLEADIATLDALDVPAKLRRPAELLNDDDFEAVFRWADPEIPDPAIDPYEHGLSGDDLRRMFGSAA